ncbi:MAG: hypothetical protein ACKORC_00775 [Acidimicrobiia bacterium]
MTFAIAEVTLVAAGMIAVGLALGALTWWTWRASEPESPVLAPLEVMGDRAFAQADDATRKRMLDEVRARPESVLGPAAEPR